MAGTTQPGVRTRHSRRHLAHPPTAPLRCAPRCRAPPRWPEEARTQPVGVGTTLLRAARASLVGQQAPRRSLWCDGSGRERTRRRRTRRTRRKKGVEGWGDGRGRAQTPREEAPAAGTTSEAASRTVRRQQSRNSTAMLQVRGARLHRLGDRERLSSGQLMRTGIPVSMRRRPRYVRQVPHSLPLYATQAYVTRRTVQDHNC